MVRSKSESGRSFLHLAEQIRSEDKYFNNSRLEVANRIFANDQIELETEHSTVSDGGQVWVPIKLAIAVRQRKYWSAALILQQVRIDGIDWQPAYPLVDGTVGRGWHRHEWNPDEQHARIHVPLPDSFGVGLRTVNDFLIRMSSSMRITWNASDAGFSDELPFA